MKNWPALRTSPGWVRFGELPVEQLVDHRVDEIGAAVLIVQVVGVLPNIHGEEARLLARHGRVGIGGVFKIGGFDQFKMRQESGDAGTHDGRLLQLSGAVRLALEPPQTVP